MRRRANLRLPRQHGAWAMLYVPFVMGVLVADRFSGQVLLLFLSVTFLFIARESILTWYRGVQRGRDTAPAGRLMLIYLGLAVIFGAPLLLQYRRFGLIPLGMLVLILLCVNTHQALRGEDRTVFGELLALLGLTMTAPAAHYIARGSWEITALWLWLLSGLYFTSSILYVKLRLFTVHPRRAEARQQTRRQCAFYHSFLALGLLAFFFTHSLNLLILIAFAPILVRTGWQLLRPTRQINLRRVGALEILYSIIYLIFMTLYFSQS